VIKETKMDIMKADYFAIVQFGNLDLLQEKLALEKDTIEDIKNLCDTNNMSLLEKSLSYGKFDISKYLLDNNVEVNVITKQGCNELHYIASNLNSKKAIGLANRLVEKNVDLNLQDKKFKNSPFWYLCQESMRRNTADFYEFIGYCFGKNPDIDSINIAGISIREMVVERKNPVLIKFIEKEV